MKEQTIDRKLILENFQSPVFKDSFFLSIEGIEGSGKSTQITLIRDYLEKLKKRVILLREPGGTEFGEQLRQAVLHGKTTLHPLAEAHLFASSRAQLLHEVIIKELSVPNTIVLCDRYIDSSLVYQGRARGLGIDTILQIHAHFPLNLLPHRTYFLRIDLETSKVRLQMRNSPKDYFEAQSDNFYNKLIAGYDEVKDIFPDRILSVDSTRESIHVFQQIREDLDKLLQSSEE